MVAINQRKIIVLKVKTATSPINMCECRYYLYSTHKVRRLSPRTPQFTPPAQKLVTRPGHTGTQGHQGPTAKAPTLMVQQCADQQAERHHAQKSPDAPHACGRCVRAVTHPPDVAAGFFIDHLYRKQQQSDRNRQLWQHVDPVMQEQQDSHQTQAVKQHREPRRTGAFGSRSARWFARSPPNIRPGRAAPQPSWPVPAISGGRPTLPAARGRGFRAAPTGFRAAALGPATRPAAPQLARSTTARCAPQWSRRPATGQAAAAPRPPIQGLQQFQQFQPHRGCRTFVQERTAITATDTQTQRLRSR